VHSRRSSRIRARLLIPIVVLFLLAAGCGSDSDGAEAEPTTTAAAATTTIPEAEPAEGNVQRFPNIDYTGTGASLRMMDVWAPTEPGDWPAVVIVHGVGRQSMASFQPMAKAIAEQGAVAYNIDVDDTIPFITAIQQVACAVRFAESRTEDFGGDGSRIVLLGNSIGAPVAIVVAFDVDQFSGPCAVEDAPGHVDAFVGYEGDFEYLRSGDYFRIDHRYLEEDDPELFALMNPANHIGSNPDLVVKLIAGVDEDEMWYDVPPAVTEDFGRQLETAGYDVEVTILEGATHVDVMNPDTEAFQEVVAQTAACCSG
jgi:acetyl esterase/lipase